MVSIVTNEQLEQLGQYMWKQLKNRYNDKSFYRRFVTGVDVGRMRIYDVDGSAQPTASMDSKTEAPVMDSAGGERKKWDKSVFEEWK